MEFWVLGAGALVLIAITLWIVWPARTTDTVGTSVRGEEVSSPPMSEKVPAGLGPQGNRFEDQYTSATADLSAGGVAAVMAAPTTPPGTAVKPALPLTHSVPTQDPVPQTRGQRWPEADAAAAHIGQASRAENFPYELSARQHGRGFLQSRTIRLGAASLFSLGGAIGGAWLYARWARERNKPINRLRRGARDVAQRVGDRLPDELPVHRAPVGGAAGALLLAALLGSRALRHESEAGLSTAAVNATLERGRAESRKLARRVPYDRLSDLEAKRPSVFGVGFGGLAAVAGAAFVVWHLMRRRGKSETPYATWYAGE